jgi:hypothetical protein
VSTCRLCLVLGFISTLSDSFFLPAWRRNSDWNIRGNQTQNKATPYQPNIPAEKCPIPASLKKRRAVNWIGLFVFLAFIAAFGFYVYIRATRTLGLGSMLWYGILILTVEIIGGLAMLPYGLCLVLRVTNGAPPALDGKGNAPPTILTYHLRVAIPCYKEPLEVIGKTVMAALHAPIPGNCRRTVYLLDDGKDPEKKAFMRGLGMRNAVYIR